MQLEIYAIASSELLSVALGLQTDCRLTQNQPLKHSAFIVVLWRRALEI